VGKILALTGLALAASLTACAGTQGLDAPDRIELTGLDVAADPQVDVRYPALLAYEAKGDVRVLDSCFTWTDQNPDLTWFDYKKTWGDGPYCFGPERGADPGAVKAMLATGYPGTYQLEGYVRYLAGGALWETNRLSTEVTVAPRY
jgi:hypothetical protein